MQDYLQRNELLCIYQSGFGVNHSTDKCLFQLTDMVSNGIETGSHTGIILINLQTAFDILDYKILLDKTMCIGSPDKTTRFQNLISQKELLFH